VEGELGIGRTHKRDERSDVTGYGDECDGDEAKGRTIPEEPALGVEGSVERLEAGEGIGRGGRGGGVVAKRHRGGGWQALLRRRYTDDELRRALRENRRIMEVVVAWLWRRATGSDQEINPYKIALEPSDIVQAPRRLDMFEELDGYIKSRTIVRDGLRMLVDSQALEQASE
jgi:hypothetical protein